MSNLQQRQDKIQNKHKQTNFRDFVMEIGSRRNLMFYRNKMGISKYPQEKNRTMNTVSLENYNNLNSKLELEYQKGMNFLEQFSYLYHNDSCQIVNHYGKQDNSQRGDEVRGAKNAYLSVAVGDNAENVIYTFKGESNVNNILNCVNITQNCSNIYNSKTIRGSYNIFFCKFIYNCANIRFCDNLIGCTECILSSNLENKSYYINNQEFSKDEYFTRKNELLKNKKLFESYYDKLTYIGNIRLCQSTTGHTLFNCHNTYNAYEVSNIKDSRNILYCDGGNDSSDCYDTIDSATDRTHHIYGVMGQAFGDHIYCSCNIVESSYIYYSFMLQNCTYCFGCTGLSNKSYCILNKQYTKEERYEKVDEIFGQMETDGTLGQFFPADMNPFYFNDTAAYLIDPSFTKEEVTAKGYLRRDEPIKVDIPEGAQVVKTTELDQFEGFDAEGNRKIDESICKRVIIDESGNAYRVIPMELAFLNKYGLPVPRKHRLDRMKENFRIK